MFNADAERDLIKLLVARAPKSSQRIKMNIALMQFLLQRNVGGRFWEAGLLLKIVAR